MYQECRNWCEAPLRLCVYYIVMIGSQYTLSVLATIELLLIVSICFRSLTHSRHHIFPKLPVTSFHTFQYSFFPNKKCIQQWNNNNSKLCTFIKVEVVWIKFWLSTQGLRCTCSALWPDPGFPSFFGQWRLGLDWQLTF